MNSVAAAPEVVLATWNLLDGGVGPGGRDRLPDIAKVIAGLAPHLLVACEAGPLGGDAAAVASALAPLRLSGVAATAEGAYPVALLARPPARLLSWRCERPGTLAPAVLATVELPWIGVVQVAGVHLDHRDPIARAEEARRILDFLDPSMPRLVMGDLNGVPPGDEVEPGLLARLPEHHVPRHAVADPEAPGGWRLSTAAGDLLAAAGLVDAWRAAGGGGPGHTVPTALPSPARFAPLRLDQAWLSAGVAARLLACEVVRDEPAASASDHLPVVVRLRGGRE